MIIIDVNIHFIAELPRQNRRVILISNTGIVIFPVEQVINQIFDNLPLTAGHPRNRLRFFP